MKKRSLHILFFAIIIITGCSKEYNPGPVASTIKDVYLAGWETGPLLP